VKTPEVHQREHLGELLVEGAQRPKFFFQHREKLPLEPKENRRE